MFKPTLSDDVTKVFPVPESEASVTIRAMKSGERELIRQETVDTKADADGKMVIGFDLAKRKALTVEACIDDWSGFTGKNGKHLKFTAGNVDLMILESTEFVDWVNEKHDELVAEAEGEEDAVEEN